MRSGAYSRVNCAVRRDLKEIDTKTHHSTTSKDHKAESERCVWSYKIGLRYFCVRTDVKLASKVGGCSALTLKKGQNEHVRGTEKRQRMPESMRACSAAASTRANASKSREAALGWA